MTFQKFSLGYLEDQTAVVPEGLVKKVLDYIEKYENAPALTF